MDWSTLFSQDAGILIPIGTIIFRIIGAVIITIVGMFIGKTVGKGVRKIIENLDIRKQFKKAGMKFKPELLAENTIKYVIYIGSGIFALNYLGITPIILNIIFVSLILIIILTVFLSLKDFIPNIISGIYVISINKINKGDNITVINVTGKVQEISLTETTLTSEDGNMIMIPNSTIMKSQIIIHKPLKKTSRKKK